MGNMNLLASAIIEHPEQNVGFYDFIYDGPIAEQGLEQGGRCGFINDERFLSGRCNMIPHARFMNVQHEPLVLHIHSLECHLALSQSAHQEAMWWVEKMFSYLTHAIHIRCEKQDAIFHEVALSNIDNHKRFEAQGGFERRGKIHFTNTILG